MEVYLLYKAQIRKMHGNWEETPLIKIDDRSRQPFLRSSHCVLVFMTMTYKAL